MELYVSITNTDADAKTNTDTNTNSNIAVNFCTNSTVTAYL